MNTILQTESSKPLENSKKSNSGADVGPRSGSEKLERMFGSKRQDSESSTDIDRQKQRLRHEFSTGCARWGLRPTLGHGVYTMAGDMWRVLARRMMKRQVASGVHKKKFSIHLEWQKMFFFSGLGGYRTTPRASSRPVDHRSTRSLRGHNLYSLALPETKRVGRGLSLCRDRASIVARADFYQRVCNLQREKKLRRLQPLEKIEKKQTFFPFFLFSHSGSTRISSAVL